MRQSAIVSPRPLSIDETPFVLLDDARHAGAAAARLFRDPVDILTADSGAGIPALLDRIDKAARGGLFVAGYLAYDAGPGFAPSQRGQGAQNEGGAKPLAWFGLFKAAERIAAADVPALLPDSAGAWLGKVKPDIDRADYMRSVGRILDFIAAGDIYQANLTFRAHVALVGNPLAAYARLRGAARAGYGGVLWTGHQCIASLSPELFFHLQDGAVMARPMKGTAVRCADPVDDGLVVAGLASDPKQRAENLMIVDLIRNDLSRVATPGSVRVPDLFRVETFPTIHQLVSDVSARLPGDKTAVDVLRAAFPCGSITGAPKVRAMEIIAEEEADPRGVYTGSIGFLSPDGEAAFNVAIRTLVFPASSKLAPAPLPGAPIQATLGLGSGIIADSRPADEWEECLAKGAFVGAVATEFDLIETMHFDPMDGVQRLDGHLERLKKSAECFGFRFDRHGARNNLQAVTFRMRDAARVRLRLARSGALAIEVSPIPHLADLPITVAACPLPSDPDDFRLSHKTSLRDLHEQARQDSGAAEVIFVDPQGFVTEGSWTNVFVEQAGRLLTPPASLGLLPGVLRAELLAAGRAVEARLRLGDLADGFFIGNSLRGLMPARLVGE